MSKNVFYNNKVLEGNLELKNSVKSYNRKYSKNVDINKLLNRVKIDQKNETKRKIIFYSLVILGLSLLGTLITFLK